MQRAERLKLLPPYLFKEIDRLRDEVRSKGVDIIDLGVGDPDQPTPEHIVESLRAAAGDASNHRYPAYSGLDRFRVSAAGWYKRRFGVDLTPSSEVITLIGSKEGIAHFPVAFVNPGEVVLVPSPAYPVYSTSTLLVGGKPVEMPLLKQNGFLPDLEAIDPATAKAAKVMVVNYPNNPTAAVAEADFYQKLVEFALKHNIIVVSDAAYTEMAYDGYRPMSFMQVEGAKEVGIEFHSLSKTYNMTGWRLGFAVGNAELVSGLGQVKSQIDSGAFDAVQLAGITALEAEQDCLEDLRQMYTERRDVLVEGLQGLGLEVEKPKATFYVWCGVPKGMKSADFTMRLLSECGVVTTPGNGFGSAGEGYVRFALTVDKKRMAEAVQRMAKLEM
ncbi:MAG: LL-diaminopimelate aminotransferase [Desulfarculaceae bacterium]|nr:LL-diaminopimelate aminotransferase [Desulfarculaceae bacterium]MCF8073466.1 LL-diaminopimelate aminotransferase [Desulfarculaceae bacterium]MCF8100387.1 LL-diaminopimelate aminotransferase [Desulfarculaceae bacterium]MCF8115877.1 LL-diaminopimelate aminotransferase [Desulfarculaceae bacterium]